MKTNSTFCNLRKKSKYFSFYSFISRCIVLALFFVSGFAMEGQGQGPTKNLATVDAANTNSYVDNASNANADNGSVATLKAHPGTAINFGKYNGKLGFEFSTLQDANTTTYVRIRAEESGLLDALLGGSVGNLVAGLVKGLVLGDHFFKVNVYNGNTQLPLNANSKNGFTDSRLRLIRNVEGHYLLAITPNASYDRIVIENQSDAAVGLLTPVKKFYVYNAYTLNGLTDCTPSLNTYYDGKGITLNLLKLGGTEIKNTQNVIDADPDSFSEINVGGLLTVAASMSQHIVFPTLSTPQHHFTVKLAINSSKTLNAEVLGAYEIVAWDGETEVYKHVLAGGMLNGVDVLGLLASGQPATLTFGPSKAFDRIEIRVNSLIGMNVASSSVKVYDVKRYGPGCPNTNLPTPTPTDDPFQVASCAGELGLFENVDFAANAVDGNNETYATLHASTGTLLVSQGYSGFIEMKLPAALDAKRTSYVRIDMDDDILDRLVNGSIGKLVSGVGGLLLGNHYFEVEATNDADPVLSSSSADSFEGTTGGTVKIVQDNIGRYYVAITPNGTYNTIRITERVSGLPTGVQKNMKIYDLCYEMGTDKCFAANFTSFDGRGLNLGILDNGAGVEDADHAISDNSSDYSRISLGTVAVGADVNQTIYFNKPSESGDELKVRLQIEPSSLLDVNLLGTYYIKTYLGDTEKESFTLQGGLINSLNLLNLFKGGGVVNLSYITTEEFDRVVVGLNGVVGLGLTPPMRLYSVKRVNADCHETTTPSPFESPTCADNLIDASNADDIQNLFDGDFDSYATLNSGAGSLLGIGQFEGFVELGFDAPVPTDKTTYIRIDYEPTLLKALLGGSLGGALAGLVDNVLLGNHYFSVQVKNGTTSLFTADIRDGFAGSGDVNGKNPKVRVVQDAAGRYYIAITAGVPYTSVKITDHTSSVVGLLAQPNTMNVYGACFDSPLGDCAQLFATSYDGTGITLDVAGVSGVKNADHAIDANTDNYSELSLGTVAIAGSVKQLFFFNQVGKANDVVNVNLAIGAGAVDLAVLGNLEIKAYKGLTEVVTLDWNNGLISAVNVVDLLNTGNKTEISFRPGVEFDRISVGINTLLQASVMPALRVYSVIKDCDAVLPADFDAWKSANQTSVQGGEEIEYTIYIRNNGSTAINGFVVEDEVPAFTTYVSGGTLDGTTVRFSGINVAAGAVAAVKFTVKVADNLTGATTISNVALVKGNPGDPEKETVPPADPTDPTSGPDETVPPGTPTEVTADAVHDIDISLTGVSNGTNTGQALAGNQITYTVTITNTGNKDLTNISLVDAVPDYTTFVSSLDFTKNGDDLEKSGITLAFGETKTYTFVVKVDDPLDGAATDIYNKVTVSFPHEDSGQPDKTDFDDLSIPTACTEVDASNIELTQDLTIICSGETVILTAEIVGGVTLTDDTFVKWYTKSDRTGFVGEGLSIIMTPTTTTTYYVVVEGVGYCFNNPPTSIAVTVNPRGKAADIDVIGDGAICATTETILTASLAIGSTIQAPIFHWYKNADLSDSPSIGATFTATGLTIGANDFYVTVSGDDVCENTITTAKKVTVTVGEVVEAPQVISSITISAGQTTSLTAALGATQAGNASDYEIVWKDGITETVGANFTVPSTLPIGEKTYQVFVRHKGTTCISPLIDVKVIVTAVINTDCLTANSQRNKVEGILCLLCGVTDANNAVDGTFTSYSVLQNTVGVAAKVWQELIFPNAGKAGDIVSVVIGGNNTLLDVTVLADLIVSTYNGNTKNNDGIGTSSIIDIKLLPGSTDANVIRFVSGGNFDRVRIEERALVVALNNGIRIYGARIELNSPKNILPVDGTKYCAGEEVIFSATAGANTLLRWFKPDGSLLGNGTTVKTTIPADASGELIYYVVPYRLNSGVECFGEQIPVKVFVNPTSVATDITADGKTICFGESAVLAASSTTVTNNPVFNWYSNASLTQHLFTGSSYTASGLAVGAHIFYVTVQDVDHCENAVGSAKEVEVIVQHQIVKDDIKLPPTLSQCVGSDVLLIPEVRTGLAVTDPVFTWYLDAAGTQPITDATVGSVTYTIDPAGRLTISGLAANSNPTYYVSLNGDNVCANVAGDLASVKVEISNSLDAPSVESTSVQVCYGGDATLKVLSPQTSLAYHWYTEATSGTAVHTGSTFPLTNIIANAVYYVEAVGAGGCSSVDRTKIEVTVNRFAIAADVDVTANNTSVCAGESAVLTATSSTLTNPVFHWYDSNGGPVVGGANGVLTLNGLAVGSYTYSVGVSGDGVCESAVADRKSVTFVVTPLATSADIAEVLVNGVNPITPLCLGPDDVVELTAELSASSTIANPVFHWYNADGVAITGGANGVLNLGVLAPGTYTYSVGVSGDGVCESAVADRKSVTFTINSPAQSEDIAEVLINGGTSTLVCIALAEETLLTAQLSGASTIKNPVFYWYKNGAKVQGGIDGVLNLGALLPGTYTYYVGVSGDGVCETLEADRKAVVFTLKYCDSGLSISKVADQARVKAGMSTSFTVTITNNGPAEIAVGKVISLTERPSAGLNITGYEVTSANATITNTANKAKVTTTSVIPVKGTIKIKITAFVLSDAPAMITNGVSVWRPDVPETEDPDDEDDTPEIPVDRDSKLSINKVADQVRVKAGESTTFTVTIINNGPADIAIGKKINLTERPGQGVSIAKYEVISDNGTITGTANKAVITTSKLVAKGEKIIVKITAMVASDASKSITNGITVWGPDKQGPDDPDDKDDTPEIPVDHDGPTAVDDNVTVKSGSKETIDVLANDIAADSPIDPSSVVIVTQPARGTATVNADGTISYTPNSGQKGTDEFTYQMKDERGNLSNTAKVTAIITFDSLSIPNVFTPNGDGLNDVFEIKGLDYYSENEITILNRWGNKVYKKNNYKNEWAGENLNEGTYYYILKVRNQNGEWEVFRGHIALIRSTK